MRALRAVVFGLSAALAIAVAPSCGGANQDGTDDGRARDDVPKDGGPDGDRDRGGISFQAFCEDQLSMWCDYYVRCGIAESAATCESALEYVVEQFLGTADLCVDLRSAIRDGRLAYHPEHAAACQETIRRAFTCEVLPDFTAIPACQATLEGKVVRNGSCFIHEECGAADYCTGQDDSCPGTCQSRKGVGELAHGDDRECKAGLYAYPSLSGATCQAPAQPGASCAQIDDGGPLQQCTSGYFCSTTTERCTALGNVNAACLTTEECAGNLECRAERCQPLVGIDGACSLSGDATCKLGLTCDSLTLDEPGACVPVGAAGAGCWTEFDCTQPTGLYCSGADSDLPTRGVCATRKAEGTACEATDECDLSLFCSTSTHVCEGRKTVGTPCSDQTECRAPLLCLAGACAESICRDPTP
jgi:hypothetical protein